MKKNIIKVSGTEIIIFKNKESDFISLTDIARYRGPETDDIIKNWLRNRGTLDFLGLWEKLNNPNFKPVEFDGLRNSSGNSYFVLSPSKWVTITSARGIIVKQGKYGGTFAHPDIAFKFASWISAEFELFLIKEFQRLKAEESERLRLGWDVKRTLAKINYKIHTDAIKENLIPKELTKNAKDIIYANEADVLNMALFGITAKDWRDKNLKREGNIRDYSTVEQLVILANLEGINAELIRRKISQGDRLIQLNAIAIFQMKSLLGNNKTKQLRAKNANLDI